MSIAAGKPPFDEVERERMAKALCLGEAYGNWLSSKESNWVFERTIRKLGGPGLLAALEGGAIYVLQFYPAGKRRVKGDLPRFDEGWIWLDANHARLVIQRQHALAEVAGNATEIPPPPEGGGTWMSDEAKIDYWVDTYEAARLETLPEVRRRIRAAPPKVGG